MISPRQAIVTFFLVAIGMAACIAALGGTVMPAPLNSIGPATSQSFRTDLVNEQAARSAAGCLLVVGNSRVAFHVNAVALSTPSCPAKNLGYPGVYADGSLGVFKRESGRARPKHVVLFLTEDYLFNDPFSPRVSPFRATGLLASPREELEKLRPVRWIEILLYRVNKVWDLLFGRPLNESWLWQEALERWEWPNLATSTLSNRPDLASVVKSVAVDYYRGALAQPAEVAAFVEQIKAGADRLTIVSPPEHSAFKAEAERLRPGMYDSMKRLIAEVAKAERVEYIDCAELQSCDVPEDAFADPVHFHDDAAVRFTQFLKARLERANH